jgi:hypothetical protein
VGRVFADDGFGPPAQSWQATEIQGMLRNLEFSMHRISFGNKDLPGQLDIGKGSGLRAQLVLIL